MTEDTPRSEARDWSIAYHEAGHAFVGYLSRAITGKIKYATIQRENIDGVLTAGHVKFSFNPLMTSRPRTSDFSDEQWRTFVKLQDIKVLIDMAGLMAEANWESKRAPASVPDTLHLKQSVPYVDSVHEFPKAANAGSEDSDICKARKTLSFYTAESEIDGRMWAIATDACLMLFDGWPAVQSVADALVRKRTLSGQEVGSIIEYCCVGYDSELKKC